MFLPAASHRWQTLLKRLPTHSRPFPAAYKFVNGYKNSQQSICATSMRRTFIVMRHAKSDWGQAGLADHDRPLNQRGRRASKAMAHVLAEHDFIVDVILASTAVRVQETVQRLQRTWSPHAEVLSQRELYLASPDEMARSIHALHDSWARVLLVGHNPGIAALATWLSGQQLEMPTAAVAVFEAQAETWQNTLQADTWKLKAYWKPRDFE